MTFFLEDALVHRQIRASRLITVEEIKRQVAEYFKLDVASFSSRGRKQAIVWPRQLVMYLARTIICPGKERPRSYNQIASRLGNRNHATIIHGIRRVEEKRSTTICCNKADETIGAILSRLDP